MDSKCYLDHTNHSSAWCVYVCARVHACVCVCVCVCACNKLTTHMSVEVLECYDIICTVKLNIGQLNYMQAIIMLHG